MTAALTAATLLCSSGCQGYVQADDKATVDATVATAEAVPVPEGAIVASDFTLTDTNGKQHRLQDYLDADKTVVLEWFNPQCPVSKRYHSPERKMAATAAQIAGDDVVWLAINSGAPGNQGHGLPVNQGAIQDWAIEYPVLIDESGEVGHAYAAKTTPHMFVIRPDGVIAYDGAIDDSGGHGEAGENLVVSAVTACRAGNMPANSKNRPFGCSVKY
jgi:peroxiredoxin